MEISPEILRQILRYEPDTGKLFWLPRSPTFRPDPKNYCSRWNARYAGLETFVHKDRKGYFKGTIFNATYRAHRVAWAIYYGKLPSLQIDHINMDRSDNRISNLREADNAQNNMNRRKQSNNKSGFKGVFWDARRGKWVASLRVNGQLFSGGAHKTPEQAAAAYQALCRDHHGEFARTQ